MHRNCHILMFFYLRAPVSAALCCLCVLLAHYFLFCFFHWYLYFCVTNKFDLIFLFTIVITDEQTYAPAQCAAVSTHCSLMMLPPQKCPREDCKDTCHGQLCGVASTPPTTRTLTAGGIAGRPHPATPGGWTTSSSSSSSSSPPAVTVHTKIARIVNITGSMCQYIFQIPRITTGSGRGIVYQTL